MRQLDVAVLLSFIGKDFAPHDVTFYLRELAAAYHSYYDSERILVDDEGVKKARLALVAACAQVLHNGLAVLGVLPRFLLWSALLWPLLVVWSVCAMRRGLGFETALWMQRRYRLLFALIGLAMLATAFFK